MNKLFIFLFFILSNFVANAQVTPAAEARAREELSKRGLNDEEVRKRLSAKGIDVNAINPNDAAAMFKAQKALEDVLKEMEAENVTKNNANNGEAVSNNQGKTKIDTLKESDKKIIAQKADEVSKSVKDGASLEEAVSETLNEVNNKNLPPAVLYGQEMFRTQSIKLYRQSKDVKAPDSYVLGVGDVLAVTIWGDSEESSIYEINEDGYIKPSGIARIYLKGVKYGEAKNLLRKKFSNYYRFNENQFEVSINFARTINVSIVGEVFNFGSFNIPAINTAFNALVAAGGPNDIGSVRNIKLMRPNAESKNIDIYKYLFDPNIGADFYLQENDIIYVPAAQKVISITGAVLKPFAYELKETENLKELIKYARGLKPNAFRKNIQVIRFESDKEIIIDVDWNDYESSSKDFILKSGDRVVVNEIESTFENFVAINGALKNPGNFAFVKGDRLSTLFKKVELENTALLELSYLKRLNEDGITISYLPINISDAIKNPGSNNDILLQPKDLVTIISKSNLVDNSYFAVLGAVRNPDTFAYDFKKSIKVSDALILSNGRKDNSRSIAFITRVDKDNPKQNKYIKIDLDEIERNPQGPSNIYLDAKDVVTIYAKEDFVDEATVTIGGEVREPAVLVYDPSLTIQDVIQLAKGLSLQASNSRIDVFRLDYDSKKSTKIKVATVELDNNLNVIGDNFTLKPFDEIYVRKAPEFELPKRVRIRGEVKYPGEYVLIKDNETFSSLINRAGGLTNEASLEAVQFYRESAAKGFVTADFIKAIKKPNSFNDIVLFEKDDIVIPKIENLVTIFGSTRAAASALGGATDLRINVPYEGKKSAKYYIENYAGGANDNGDITKLSVKNLNGKVKGVKKFLFFNIYPKVEKGSIVYIPNKPIEELNKENKDIDWNKAIGDSVAQATSILTLILLLNRL